MGTIINPKKVAVIGCGFVGSATAFTLMQSRLFSEMALLDIDRQKAEGEAQDIAHGIPFAGPMKLYAGDYDDIADAAIVIITAGANQKPGETRLELVQKNVGIYRGILAELRARSYSGILLVVSNPVDILTYTANCLSGLPEHRVIGSGTVLDSARLKYALGAHLHVDSRSVHAYIVGEHGDSEIAAWSSANISGIPLQDFCRMRGHYHHDETMEAIAQSVKNSAYEIISKKARPITALQCPCAASASASCATSVRSCRSRPCCTAATASATSASVCPRSSVRRGSRRPSRSL